MTATCTRCMIINHTLPNSIRAIIGTLAYDSNCNHYNNTKLIVRFTELMYEFIFRHAQARDHNLYLDNHVSPVNVDSHELLMMKRVQHQEHFNEILQRLYGSLRCNSYTIMLPKLPTIIWYVCIHL